MFNLQIYFIHHGTIVVECTRNITYRIQHEDYPSFLVDKHRLALLFRISPRIQRLSLHNLSYHTGLGQKQTFDVKVSRKIAEICEMLFFKICHILVWPVIRFQITDDIFFVKARLDFVIGNSSSIFQT